jgi:hypothetical protein
MKSLGFFVHFFKTPQDFFDTDTSSLSSSEGLLRFKAVRRSGKHIGREKWIKVAGPGFNRSKTHASKT